MVWGELLREQGRIWRKFLASDDKKLIEEERKNDFI